MKFKKVVSLLTAMLILGSTVIMPVSAEVATSSKTGITEDAKKENMKKALAKVKSRITIPENLAKFDYSSYSENNDNSFYFSWSDDNYNSLSVAITDDIISSYYIYKYDPYYTQNEASFAKLSDEKIIAKAKEYAKTINPDIYDKLKFEIQSIDINSDRAQLYFKAYENDININDDYGYISVDKNTGELLSYDVNWLNGAEFKKPDNIKSVEEIKESYKKLCKLELQYIIDRDYETGAVDVLLNYSPDFTSEIDAFTGKKSSYDDDLKKAQKTTGENGFGFENPATGEGTELVEDEAAEEESVSFTEQELKAIDENSKLISKDEAVSIAMKDKYLKLDDNYKVSNSRLTKSGYPYENVDDYSWNINFFYNDGKKTKNVNVTLDAETGNILSFYKYSSSDVSKKKYADTKNAVKLADEAAAYYLGDKSKEFKMAAGSESTEKSTTCYVDYVRYVNGISVLGNRINFTIDANNEITNFSYNYDDVKFPAPEVISQEKAFEKLFDQMDFDIYYHGFSDYKGNVKTYLSYSMDSFSMNAFTGEIYGAENKEDDGKYSDLSGHWSEKYVEKLAKYNIMLEAKDGKFMPDSSISEEEFQYLLNQIISSNYYLEEQPVEEVAESDTSVKKETIKKNYITKAEACKMFVEYTGGKNYAELKGIYKVPFKDASSSRADIGYIAIAYGKGFVVADSKGNFNPDAKLSRAMAMFLIYNYLSK